MKPIRLHASLLAFGTACLALPAAPAMASEPSLIVVGSPKCPVDSERLARRIERAVVGAANPELRVEVQLADAAATTSALVRVWLDGGRWASKQLEAATCEEVLDAVVAVTALALSSEAATSEAPGIDDAPGGEAVPERGTSVEPTGVPGAAPPPTPRSGSLADSGTLKPRAARAWSLGGFTSFGVDHGIFPEAVPFLRLGLAWGIGRAELRAAGAYGMAARTEEVGPASQLLRENADYGALNLDYCHGVDRERWLSACGGLELGVVRTTLVHESTAERHSLEALESSLASSFAALFAFRSMRVQPELLLATRLLLLGGAPESQRWGARASLGAKVPF